MKREVHDRSGSSFSSLSLICNTHVELVYPSTPVTFRHRDGLPIKISAKVVAKLDARCVHGVDNILYIDIKPDNIDWLIEGEGKMSGAFKVGHSDKAEYLSRDYWECVIYHPPLESAKTSEGIEIVLKHATGDSKYRINIDLQKEEGFGKGLSSLANITLTPANQLNMQSQGNRNCRICKPDLIFDKSSNRIVLAGMGEERRYLMTSEYVKMVAHADEKGRIWLTSGNQEQLPLKDLAPDQDLEWQCSAGDFIGLNTGRSVVYLTPDESELSKSPVSITLQADGKSIATKRFWLLRRSSGMHC